MGLGLLKVVNRLREISKRFNLRVGGDGLAWIFHGRTIC